MALDESVKELQKLESNGIVAYVEGKLGEYMATLGGISIDFSVTPGGGGGYSIRPGKAGDPSCDGCTSC